MAGGYAGKILQVDLTNRTFGTIDTAEYSDKFFGGHGIGQAIFWDRGPHENIDGLDPRNIAMVLTGPLAGTLAPSSGGRVEHMGVAPNSYTKKGEMNGGWLSRSGHGGRVATQLKQAGWDGVVIEGKASSPVWLNIINDEVTLEDASDLWGLDTWLTQEEIWRRVTGFTHRWGEWLKLPDGSFKTQRPAVTLIGPGGESGMVGGRVGAIASEGGRGAGEGGLGSIWGSKNLKAISALGSAGVEIADPKTLMDLRVAHMEWLKPQINLDAPTDDPTFRQLGFGLGPGSLLEPNRLSSSCDSCAGMCTRRSLSGTSNDAQCSAASWYSDYYGKDAIWYWRGHPDYVDPWTEVRPLTVTDSPATPDVRHTSIDIRERAGLDARQLRELMNTIRSLYEQGTAGPGGAANGFEIDTDPLPMEKAGTVEFVAKYVEAVANREGIGEAVSLGMPRFCLTYGKHKEWYEQGRVLDPAGWGYEFHHFSPNIEWGYYDLVTERDSNEHSISSTMSSASEALVDANFAVQRFSEMCAPYTGDPYMFDYTWQGQDGSGMAQALNTGIYSRHKAKEVVWMIQHGMGYIQSAPVCCWRNMNNNWFSGFGPEFTAYQPTELPQLVKAITGKDISYADQHEVIGRRIMNIRRAIHILQGRHRDQEVFSDFFYGKFQNFQRKTVTTYNESTGQWEWSDVNDMNMDRDGVETWKDHYYDFNGWDTENGYPSRATLEDLDLGYVADELESAGKLGATGEYTGT